MNTEDFFAKTQKLLFEQTVASTFNKIPVQNKCLGSGQQCFPLTKNSTWNGGYLLLSNLSSPLTYHMTLLQQFSNLEIQAKLMLRPSADEQTIVLPSANMIDLTNKRCQKMLASSLQYTCRTIWMSASLSHTSTNNKFLFLLHLL